jgi:RsiW-degrading membrane proteinase PrsW (M82 family)
MTTACSRCGLDAREGDISCRACGALLTTPRAVPAESIWLLAAADGSSPTTPVPESASIGVQHHFTVPPAATPPTVPPGTKSAQAQPGAVGSQPSAPPAPAGQWPRTPAGGYHQGYGAYPLSPLYYPYAWPVAPWSYAGYLPVGYQPVYYPPRPKAAPGNGYRLFLGWFVSVGAGLTLLFGLVFTLLSVVLVLQGNAGLDVLGSDIGITVVPLIAGGVGLYFGIRSLLGRPSPRFTWPVWWVLALILLVALIGEIVIWNANTIPGNVWAILPLFTLCGLLPVLTLLGLANRRLANPSTWRHVLVSMLYGAAIATFIASILNALAFLVIVLVMQALGYQIAFNINFIQTLNPNDPTQAIAFLLVGSVAAPLIEETTKPIAAIFALPRLRSAGEAFLVGMAAGLGFAFVETLQYFGMSQADWVSVAIARLGAGLVHGVGAGMTAMGWYLLIRGRGVPLRWLKGFGAILYAIAQHAVFNASNLLGVIPAVNRLSQTSVQLGRLPLTADLVITFIIYALILAVLLIVTGRLRKGVILADREPDKPESGAVLAPTAPIATQGGAR